MSIRNHVVFITGGAGFIGSHTVDAFLQAGVERVVVYDNFSTGRMENIEPLKPRVEVIKGDILDSEKIASSIRNTGAEVVVHLAAELEVYTGIRSVDTDARTNIWGTLNVLNACIADGSQVKRMINASSGAVYGQAKYTPQDENHPWDPHWPYGVSKLAAERYCRQFWLLHGFPTVSLRYGIVYGPREWYGRALTMFLRRALVERKPPVVFGDGQQTRDYVYVEDVAEAHILATGTSKAAGEVFNISSGVGISMINLAGEVCKLAGLEGEPLLDNPPEGESSEFQPERVRLVGELRDFVLSSAHAENVLGWKPVTSFSEGLRREMEWLLANPEMWSGPPRV